MTTKLNLKVNQGATYKHTIFWVDDNDVPINITGHVCRMQARAKLDAPSTLLNLTTENGGLIIANALLGEIRIYLSATDTTNINWTSAVYDLEIEAPNGDVTRLIEGKITVTKEVTR